MNDRRIVSLISLILLLIALLGPWPIATLGNLESALAFAGSAALLSLGLALLSRSEYFSRIVLWGFGLTIGIAIVGIGISVPIWMLRANSLVELQRQAQNEQIRAEIAARHKQALADSLAEQTRKKSETPKNSDKKDSGNSGQENALHSLNVDEEHGVITIKGPKEEVERTRAILDATQKTQKNLKVDSTMYQKALQSDAASTSSSSTWQKFDNLPAVSRDFHTQTVVNGGLVYGAGIIEQIEGDTIHFSTGDRIMVPSGTMILLPKNDPKWTGIDTSESLEPGMVIEYTIRDGEIERLRLIGIVEQISKNKSIFDTIKDLQLRKGAEMSHSSIDGQFPIRLTGADGEVSVKIGETILIKLPKATESMEWRCGEFNPEGIEDIEPFDHVLVQWRKNSFLTVTCYASPIQGTAGGDEDAVRKQNSSSEQSQGSEGAVPKK